MVLLFRSVITKNDFAWLIFDGFFVLRNFSDASFRGLQLKVITNGSLFWFVMLGRAVIHGWDTRDVSARWLLSLEH